MKSGSRAKSLLSVACAVILSACTSTEGANTTLPDTLAISRTIKLSAAQIRAVHKSVQANLENPKSARFGGIAAGVSNTGTTHVCGLVDAKEQDGSYTGMTVYAGELNGDAFQFDGFGDSLELICVQQGLRPES